MTAVTADPPVRSINAADRLGFTLFIALSLHVIFILGVGFTQSDANQAESTPSLEIILANSESPEQPDEADYLAQANQKGGGNQEEKARPSAPVAAATPVDQQGMSDRSQRQQSAHRVKLEKIYYINQRDAERQVVRSKTHTQTTSNKTNLNKVEQQQRDIASLRAEIRKLTQAYAKRPRELVLTANTREAVEAGYLARWVNKIERIGNLNYPAEAEINKIEGSLRLNVKINAAGEVVDVKITRPSGQNILDQAAKRIVKLAQPFAPFPSKLKEKADQIVIVRTWQFNSNQFTTHGKS
ncbi:MAG: energy transducer TonB [Gammaproteobacteria bacterium]|nr:energy transducer TonB [Gammaproteobacteria bacterium]